MKWVTVNNSSAKEKFELWEDEKMLADISFSKQTRFVRMVSKMGKRIFSFEKRGFLNPKEIIKNEYGVKMGEVEEMKPGAGKGYIEFENKKYFFVYNEDNSGEMMLYDELMQKKLLTCSFNSISNGISKAKSLIDNKFSSLLLVLCWYAFQPHKTHLQGLFSDADLIIK